MRWLTAFLLFSGLLLSGSEGPWWPAPNIFGVILMMFAAVLARRLPLED